LATAYGIVKQHSGWITLSTQVGAGTVFELFLPAIQPPAPAQVSPAAGAATRRGTERILVVEDEAAVRLMTRRTLNMFGYQVVEAASGREALEICRSRGNEIDLLLTDVVMPDGISGHELAERLRKERPALKIVFVSGYSSNVIGLDTEFHRRDDNHFLQKPYHTHVLVDTIRRCLDDVPASARK